MSTGRVCSVQTAPTDQEGKHLSQCGPTWGQAEWGYLRSEGVPMPPWGHRCASHGEAQITISPSPPLVCSGSRPHREERHRGMHFFTRCLGSLS